jgi:agmatine/peptidylarginine deiminase
MTNTEQIMALAENFKELSENIKNDKVSIEDLKEAREDILKETYMVMDLLDDVLNDVDNEHIDAFQRIAIKESIQAEKEKYDKEEHKRTIKTVFKMVEELDEEVGEEFFVSLMLDIMERAAQTISKVDERASKIMFKQVKKYREK